MGRAANECATAATRFENSETDSAQHVPDDSDQCRVGNSSWGRHSRAMRMSLMRRVAALCRGTIFGARPGQIPARAPTAGAIGFTSHTQPGGNTDPVRPAPGQPPQTLTDGSAPRIGRGLGGPQVGSEDFVADSGRRHAA